MNAKLEKPRPARRPAAVLAALAVGFCLARWIIPETQSTWLLIGALALSGLALLLSGWACRIALVLSVVLAGAGWFNLRVHSRPGDDLAFIAAASTPSRPVIISVVGLVITPAKPADPPRGLLGPAIARERHVTPSMGFRLRVLHLDTDGVLAPASGTLRVRINSDQPLPGFITPGASIRLTGVLSPVAPALNPGEPEWDLLAAQDGVSGSLSLSDPALISTGPTPPLNQRVSQMALAIRHTLQSRALSAIRPPLDEAAAAASDEATRRIVQGRALLAALLLGQSDPALREVSSAFARLGLLHMVAISGFNLAVMAGSAVFLLRLFGDRGPLEPLLIALLVSGYLLILPAQSPILRAGLLVLALLLSEALGRRYDRLNILALTAITLLLIWPMDIFDLGFQLSFTVVAALIGLGDRFNHLLFGAPLLGVLRPHKPPGKPRPLDFVPGAIRASKAALKANVSAAILAWLISTPLVIVHTGLVSPLAIVSGILLLPLTIILLWGGYAAMLLGTILPLAAGLATGVLDALAQLLVGCVLLLDQLPLTRLYLPWVSPVWAAGTLAVIAALIRWPPRRRRVAMLLAAVPVLTLLPQVLLLPARSANVPLRIDALAVGDGSCTLLRSGGSSMLIDAGSTSSGLGERLIPQALRDLGAGPVPVVVITRPTLDAFSALADLIEPLGVREVHVPAALLLSARAAPWSPAADLVHTLRTHNVQIHTLGHADTLLLGPSTITIHAPEPRDVADPAAATTPADASLVLDILTPTSSSPVRSMLLSSAADATLAPLMDATPKPAVIVTRPRALAAKSTQRLLAEQPPKCVIVSASSRTSPPQVRRSSPPPRPAAHPSASTPTAASRSRPAAPKFGRPEARHV